MACTGRHRWGLPGRLLVLVLPMVGMYLAALQQPWWLADLADLNSAFALPARKFRTYRERKSDRKGSGISPENKQVLKEVKNGMCDPDTLREITADMLRQHRLNSTHEHMVLSQQLCRNGIWEENLSLLANWQEQPRGKEWSNMHLCNQVLAAMGKGQRRDKAVEMLAGMNEQNANPNSDSYNIVMLACQEAKDWRCTLALFDDMQKYNRRQDRFSFSYAVSACAQGREWHRAIDLLHEMSSWSSEDTRPDWRMFNLGIVMAGDGGQWETALHFLDEMWKSEVLPDGVTYDAAVRVCERCQRWEEALHLVRQMRRRGFRPEGPTYEAVAASCRSCGQDQLAESLEREAQILLS